MMIDLRQGDCLELMRDIPAGSVDMILCDLPYGTTVCAWDSVIPFECLWEQYNRLIKSNGAIVLFGSEPFASKMRTSNLDMFKYDWVWRKTKSANFVHAKNMPLKFHETISVFSKAPIGHISKLGDKRMCYIPQDIREVNKTWKRPRKYEDGGNGHHLCRESHKLTRTIQYENYPSSVLCFSNSSSSDRGLHPTQKPVALLEYLIKTYTNPGETVLDNCMGSGSTGVACVNTGRRFIGIELDEHYFSVARERINAAIDNKPKQEERTFP